MPQYNQNIVGKFGDESAPVTWPWHFLSVALLIFGISLFTYIGLAFGYKSFIGSQIEQADSELKKIAAQIPVQDQDILLKSYSQIQNLKGILDKHVLLSRFPEFLQNNTNRRVYYNLMDLDVAHNFLKLTGNADSYEILAQQLEAFKRAPEVSQLLINDSRLTERGVIFTISLTLKPELFQPQSSSAQ